MWVVRGINFKYRAAPEFGAALFITCGNMEVLYQDIEDLKEILTTTATSSSFTNQANDNYKLLRAKLIQDTSLKPITPEFIRSTRTLTEFWDFIKQQASTYSERRELIRIALEPLCQELEICDDFPSDASINKLLDCSSYEYIHAEWKKALSRRSNDPEGAITSARTFVECVCKHILHDEGLLYKEDADLPQLYKTVAKNLKLSPGDYSDDILRQILSGCSSVITGLGSVRNKFGDAHGKSARHFKPAPRHAELSVNLAGAMAMFLLQTHKTRKQEKLSSAEEVVLNNQDGNLYLN